MTFGFSRDDIGSFVPDYVEKKLLPIDPFQVLDRDGVGQLVELAVKKGRATRPKLKVGICGEHGGEPQPGSPGWLPLRGRISPRWRACSGFGPCRRTRRVRLRPLPLRAPTIIGVSGLSRRTQPGLPGSSVEFCHLVGMDYVSCSPFRVPIARLAAAQAQINHPRA